MKRALVGYGGHAREVMSQMGETLPIFVNEEYMNEITLPLSQFDPNEYEVMVVLGGSKERFDMVNQLPKNTKYFSWIHPTSLIMGDVEIGEGSFIGANCILTTNIKIGKHAILNRGNQIGHDCVIGDYFSMMPGSIVSGNVRIYDVVYMGCNSSVREKISIHSLCTIGMGGTVVSNINDSGTYVGVPVKKLK